MNENSSFFKNYIVYFLMLIGIIVAIFFKNLKHQEEEVAEILKEENKSKSFNMYIILGAILIFLIVVIQMIKGSKEFEKQVKVETPKKTPVYANRLTLEEYEKRKQETTTKELDKLRSASKFQKMLQAKGEDEQNWNWQIREKSKKSVYKENEDSDDIEHLSQVGFSDDD